MASKKKRVVIGTSTTPTTPPTETVILNHSFDDWNLGTPSATYWNSKMGSGGDSTQLARTAIVSNPAGGRMFRVTLQANKTSGSGIAMVASFPGVEKATISYDVRFTSTVSGGTFDLGGGGKIPGLAGTTPDAPSLAWPAGGNYPGDMGWSGRGMWVTKDTYGSRANGEGQIYYYGYDQVDQVDPAYGENLWWGSSNVFVPGVWNHIEMTYELNTVGQSNGVIKAWMNGVQCLNISNRQIRARSDLKINHLYMDIFLGGSGAIWEVAENQWVDIDNLRITTPAA